LPASWPVEQLLGLRAIASSSPKVSANSARVGSPARSGDTSGKRAMSSFTVIGRF
jgi:hypothetical protein